MIYISGAITNNPEFKKQFKNAEKRLKSRYGVRIINPCRLNLAYNDFTYDEYIKIDLALLSLCDTIYMLNGWEQSKGANIERDYAIQNGLTILTENN